MILRVVRRPVSQPDEGRLWLQLEEGLGGAWTELHGGAEVIRFGYPARSPHRWFQVLTDPGKRHHALSLALERIVFARGIATIEFDDPTLRPMLARATRVHPAVELREVSP